MRPRSSIAPAAARARWQRPSRRNRHWGTAYAFVLPVLALTVTAVYTVGFVAVCMLLGLVIALLLDVRLPGPDTGLFNRVLNAAGLPQATLSTRSGRTCRRRGARRRSAGSSSTPRSSASSPRRARS